MASIDEPSKAIEAGVAVASLLGSGIAFLWVRVEWNNRKTRRELQKCHERENMARERRGVLMTVIEILWQEIIHLIPHHNDNHVLSRAKELLDRAKAEDEALKIRQEAESKNDRY